MYYSDEEFSPLPAVEERINIIIYLRRFNGKVFYGAVTNCKPEDKDQMRDGLLSIIEDESHRFDNHDPTRIMYIVTSFVPKDEKKFSKQINLVRFKDREIQIDDMWNLKDSKSLNINKKMSNFFKKMINSNRVAEIEIDSEAYKIFNGSPVDEGKFKICNVINSSTPSEESNDIVDNEGKGLSRSLQETTMTMDDKTEENFMKNLKDEDSKMKLKWMINIGWIRSDQIKFICDDYVLLNHVVYNGVVGDILRQKDKYDYIINGYDINTRLTKDSLKGIFGIRYEMI
jgi:hypothetical protein